jgi:hypothetical protein
MYTTDAPIKTFPMGTANIKFSDWYLNTTNPILNPVK